MKLTIDFFEDKGQDYLDLVLVNEFRQEGPVMWSSDQDAVEERADFQDFLEIATENANTDITVRCPKNDKYETDSLRIYTAESLARLIGILENHRQLLDLQNQMLDDFSVAHKNGTLPEYRKKYNLPPKPETQR
jgi:hypothetical protein